MAERGRAGNGGREERGKDGGKGYGKELGKERRGWRGWRVEKRRDSSDGEAERGLFGFRSSMQPVTLPTVPQPIETVAGGGAHRWQDKHGSSPQTEDEDVDRGGTEMNEEEMSVNL